jgi:ATP-dependent Clp protease ATP-binding subunit ClpC
VELKVPLVVVQRARRLVEAWAPTLPDVHAVGPSLAEIKDDLRLKVMERFVEAHPEEFTRYQLAPHARVEVVSVEATVHDPDTRARWEITGRVGALLEKYPGDPFWVVTPTRIPSLRFALERDEDLADALTRRVAEWCRTKDLRSLDDHTSNRRERLELLDVDAYAPSIFPTVWRRQSGKRPSPPRPDADPDAPDDDDDHALTDDSREERRRVRRLTVTALREVGRNLSYAASDDTLGRAFGRDATVDALVEEFAGREGVAVVLVGPSGAGKSAVVHEFVRRLGAWSEKHRARRDVWRVDGNRFIAGMKYVGQWEQRARTMIAELIDTGDVLYLDDLASMVSAGRTGKGDTNVAQFLEAHLARGELAVIAESTPERLAWAREESPAFARLFRVVHLPAMSERETLPVLLAALRDLEDERADAPAPPRVSPAALATALTLTARFQPNTAFPGKAVRLLRAVLDGPGEPGTARDGRDERRYDARHVREAMRQRTGLPDFVLDESAAWTRGDIRDALTAHIAGQSAAVEALTELVVAMQQVLCDPDKPLANFLFVGPTGVGKTESAKALARLLFGSAERMLRFDMSEFGAPWSVTRLLGHPGDPDGELTRALRVQPFCVVLFDEVEKAHPRVFDALLQLLGEGRISDAAGRLADARQCVVILTSNLGVREASTRSGFARGETTEARQHYLAAAQGFFRPEFFNRLDRVVPFDALTRDALRQVVDQLLTELLGRRGIERANVLVDVEPELLDVLVRRAYDPRYGARPLKREMEQRLTVPLAHHLVRRRAEDLSLVSLHRLGDDLTMTVSALPDAPSLPREALARYATLAEARRALAALRETLDDLVASDAVEDLQRQRTEAMRQVAAGGAREVPVAVELLDALTALRAKLDLAEEDERLTDGFVEEPLEAASHHLSEHGSSRHDHNRYRGGLRPRAGFIERPSVVHEESALRIAQEVLAPLDDAAVALGARLDAAARGALETLALLVEPCVSAGAAALLCDLALAAPTGLADAAVFVRDATTWRRVSLGEIVTTTEPFADSPRRAAHALCVRVRGYALGRFVAAMEGYALAEIPNAGYTARHLLRVFVLEGEVDEARLDAWARDRAARRARRAAGDDLEVDPLPARITLRHKGSGWHHVATGIAAHTHESQLAALERGG